MLVRRAGLSRKNYSLGFEPSVFLRALRARKSVVRRLPSAARSLRHARRRAGSRQLDRGRDQVGARATARFPGRPRRRWCLLGGVAGLAYSVCRPRPPPGPGRSRRPPGGCFSPPDAAAFCRRARHSLRRDSSSSISTCTKCSRRIRE